MNLFCFKRLALGLFALFSLVACGDVSESTASSNQLADGTELLTVYSSPTCGCCKEWVDHIKAEGFEANIEHPAELLAVKDQYLIAPNLRSCHTAVSSQGYVFEGHIPARYIHQFLASPPADAIGLTVPAMPIGSPGMEVDDRFTPYQVLLIKKDGSTEVFASVDNAAQQYQSSLQ